MNIVNTDGATSLQHEGVDYTANEHGVFEVPEHVGHALLGFPHWVEEHVHLSRKQADQLAHDLDPTHLAERVAKLEATVEHLLALVAPLAGPAAGVVAGVDPAAAPAAEAAAAAVEAAAAKANARKAPAKKAAAEK